MARVMLTGRVTDSQAAALRAYAADVGLPLYQATVRALEIGIATLIGGRGEGAVTAVAAPVPDTGAIEEALGELMARADRSDALLQRTLFAAGAAYAAGLAAAGEGAPPERAAAIKAEVARDSEAIFERQLAMARAP